MNLATYLPLEPRLKMTGSIPLLPNAPLCYAEGQLYLKLTLILWRRIQPHRSRRTRGLFMKLIVSQLVKTKFPKFYGIRSFSIVVPFITMLSNINPIRALSSCFFQIRFNIILPSASRSKWCISCKVPHHTPVCISALAHTSQMPCRSHSF